MHILIPVVHRPDKPTGVCRHAANLAKCLADQESVTKVTLVTGQWQINYFIKDFNLILHKVEIINVDIENNAIARNLWYLFGLPKLASELEADLIHLSFPFPFIKAKFRCPIVSTIHDLYPYECPENFGFPQVWFNRLFLKQCVQYSDGITCVSQVTLATLKKYFKDIALSKKVTVVYNYVDFDNVTPVPLESNLIRQDAEFLLSVGQHRKNKNLDLLIRAYGNLLAKDNASQNLKLVIVGSQGPETDYLLDLIEKLSLRDQVFLVSSISDAELCWLYKSCKLFIIPSSLEGFCIPLVEALSLNAKSICSDLAIFKEIGKNLDCQYFSLNGDVNKNLSEKIFFSLSDNNPPDFNKREFKVAIEKFTKPSVAKDYLAFYKLLTCY
ncbi:MAG: glycosyltransferase family 4 protein [Leptolyngbya sp. SIO3F4]|nr:glycosyltransferase family 4 protein [Leptolyngbya sp. SIO3F4]